MVTQTSLMAYCKLVQDNKPNVNQVIILDILRAVRPNAISNYDISIMLDWDINRITPRVLELRQKGLIKKVGTKTQLQTGRTVQIYCLTDDAHLYSPDENCQNLRIYPRDTTTTSSYQSSSGQS